MQALIEGDVDTAKSVLRDTINATIGFPALAKATKQISLATAPKKVGPRKVAIEGNVSPIDPFVVNSQRSSAACPRYLGHQVRPPAECLLVLVFSGRERSRLVQFAQIRQPLPRRGA